MSRVPRQSRSLRAASVGLIGTARRARRGDVDQAAVRAHARRLLLGLGSEDRARLLDMTALAAAMLAERWQQADPSAPVDQWLAELAGEVIPDAADDR